VIKKRPKKDTDSEDEHVDVQEILSKVGKKRANPFNKTATQPVEKKVKKLTSDGASESIEVPVQKAAKKPAKLPTVFKLGKWNPDTVLIKPEEELEKSSHKDSLLNNCCTRCNSRNVIRAILTNNQRLLKACINAKDTIPSLTSNWSMDAPNFNPMELMLSSGNVDMLKTFYSTVNCKAGAN
jgi:hypothetical protein